MNGLRRQHGCQLGSWQKSDHFTGGFKTLLSGWGRSPQKQGSKGLGEVVELCWYLIHCPLPPITLLLCGVVAALLFSERRDSPRSERMKLRRNTWLKDQAEKSCIWLWDFLTKVGGEGPITGDILNEAG